MDVHIGSLIKARAKAIRLGPTELGSRIESSKQNVYGIFKRKSIDTELLTKISIALDHDFFVYLSSAINGGTEQPATITKQSGKFQQTAARTLALERENEYLRRLNMLLEEKLARLDTLEHVRK